MTGVIVLLGLSVPNIAEAQTGQSGVANWTGGYGALLAGGEWHRSTIEGRVTTNTGTPYGGVLVGYNYQPAGSNWLVGAQASIGFIAVDATANVGGTDVNIKSNVEGSTLVRAGYFIVPGQTLAFVSGGAAFLEQRLTLSTPGAALGSDSTTRVGWEVVLGLEQALNEYWHMRLCYVHIDYGTRDFVMSTPVETQVNAFRVNISRRFSAPN